MKIVVTARDFSTKDRTALEMLVDAGHEIVDYSKVDMGVNTPEEVIYEAVQDADIACIGIEPYRRSLIERCPNLKMISRRGIGFDSIDLDVCLERGITVTRTVGVVEGAVAEHVMAYVLYFSRRLDLQNASMHRSEWKRTIVPGAKSRTIGLIGFGGIGKEIAKRAVPFGMKVLYYSRHPKAEWEQEYGVNYTALDELLAMSDYVSVNVPLSEATKGMCVATMFAKMKPGSIFINIARGQVMDPVALKNAIESGHLAGAGIDVFDHEPCVDSPLVGMENIILTPHTASYTSENFREMNILAAQNILDFLSNKIQEKYRLV